MDMQVMDLQTSVENIIKFLFFLFYDVLQYIMELNYINLIKCGVVLSNLNYENLNGAFMLCNVEKSSKARSI